MKRLKRIFIAVLVIFSFVLVVPIITPLMSDGYIVEAASVKLNRTKITLNVGESYTLKISGTNKKVEWSTSDKKVATVNSNGKVKAKKAGTVIITAKINKKSYKCKINVESPKINKVSKTIYIGKTFNLNITGTTRKIIWSSSNTTVATVNSNGKVTAKKIGKTIITAKVGNTEYTCKINVTKNIPREAYKDYIGYVKFGKYMPLQAKEYTIFDINQDGIDELLIKPFSNDDEFFYTEIFTYDTSKNKVVYVGEIYSFGEVSYSQKYNCLLYAEVRPSVMCGGYVLCKLQNKKLVNVSTITYDRFEGEKFYLDRPGKKTKSISKSQFNQYFKKQKSFNYKDIMAEIKIDVN